MAIGQSDTPKASLYLELGGTAGFYSINLDQIVFERPAIKLAAHIGYSYYNGSIIPAGISLLIGKETNYIEMGGSYAPYFPARQPFQSETSNFYSIQCGYRFQSAHGGLFLRFVPMYLHGGTLGNSQPFTKKFWFGLGIGFTLLRK
jgi:hypothetical protein